MARSHTLLERLMDAEALPEPSRRALRALLDPDARPLADPIDHLQATLDALPLSRQSFALLSWGDDDPSHDDAALTATALTPPPLPDRYRPIARVGVGGMGEVWCVWDHQTSRMVALKLLRDTLGARPDVVDRFVFEAHTNARLSHPNIVSVHAVGALDDGRPYFTMDLLQGKPLDRIIDEVHQRSAAQGRWTRTDDGWSLRRLVEAVVQLCDAAEAAHAAGIIHRDIKPQNAIVAPQQHVWLVDFGLARTLNAPHAPTPSAQTPPPAPSPPPLPHLTRHGAVLGTPHYMPPEQAAGLHHALDARSDVYALGALLFHCLTGAPPYAHASPTETLQRALTGPFPDPRHHTPLPLPPALVEAVAAATRHAPADRLQSAALLAEPLRQWLEGARAMDEALALVAQAQTSDAQRLDLQRRSQAKRAAAEALFEQLSPLAPEHERRPGWALLDQAQALTQAAQAAADACQNSLNAALTLVPSLASAHTMRVHEVLQRFKDAEAAHAPDDARRSLTALRLHLSALPAQHAVRVEVERYVRGEGALTLVTEPSGAEVEIYRYEEKNRRLAEVHVRTVETPVVELPLEMGSYLLIIRKDGFAPTRYPVFIERLTHWHGVPPGHTRPLPVPLLPRHALPHNALYVPPGPFWAGSRARVQNQIPPHRIWVDGFIIDRFPVTHQGYADFLNDLLRLGVPDAEVTYHAPYDARSEAHLLARDADSGAFYVPTTGDGALHPDAPVRHINQRDALAFAAWRRDITGLPWRLPMELEWEKAARGVDGRVFPWGHHTHTTWARDYGPDKSAPPAPVDSFPVDESPYGMRGAAGNVSDICLDFWSPPSPPPARLTVPPPPHTALPIYVLRGGAASFYSGACHCNLRIRQGCELRQDFSGMRLAYSAGG